MCVLIGILSETLTHTHTHTPTAPGKGNMESEWLLWTTKPVLLYTRLINDLIKCYVFECNNNIKTKPKSCRRITVLPMAGGVITSEEPYLSP